MSSLPSPFLILAILFALLSFTLFIGSVVTLKKKKFFGTAAGLTFSFLLLTLAALCGAITVGLRGYQALTHEEVVANVTTRPLGEQRFRATFEFPDGRTEVFELLGDELYVDAQILKWKSIANFLGLHTAYELDRVAGRFTKLEDEQTKERTVFSLAADRTIDIFELRRRFSRLSKFVDADYGSATYVTAQAPATFEVRVTTSGLLVRKVQPGGASDAAETGLSSQSPSWGN